MHLSPKLFKAKIVMMPCILRRQTVGGDLPLFQVAGFVARASALPGVKKHEVLKGGCSRI